MKPTFFAALLASCLCAFAAAADPTGARLVVGGDPSSATKVSSIASKWLTARGYTVEAPSGASGGPIAECLVKTSAAQCKSVIAGEAALWFLGVEADIADRSTNVVIVARLFDASGELIASERQGCERCNDDSLRQATHEILAALQTAAGAKSGSDTTIVVTSSPSKATIAVAGQPIGQSPVTYNLVPGTHQVSAAAEGYAPQTRTVSVAPGETKELAFALEAMSTRAGRKRPAWAWGLTIGGGAALVAGGIMVALHDEPERGERADKTYTDLRTPGIVVGAAGTAALAVGIWGLVKGGSAAERQPTTAIAPFVGWDGNSAAAGLAGTFR